MPNSLTSNDLTLTRMQDGYSDGPRPVFGLDDEPNAFSCKNPYGQPGDRIYVRETFRGCRAYEVQGYPPKDWGNKPIWFEADGAPPGRPDQWASRSRPSIHMPRWASRITLEVTGVRLERIQGITPDDCIAEGAWPVEQRELGRGHEAVSAFRELWESTGGDWNANPWVWAIDFKVLSTTGRPA
jgi:hypothetical protein